MAPVALPPRRLVVPRPRGLHDLPQFGRPSRSRGPVCPECRRAMVPCPDGAGCSWDGLLHDGGGHACPNGTNITSTSDLFTPHRGGDTGNRPAVRR